MMARINESTVGSTPFQRLLGHNKKILESWNQLGETFETNCSLSNHLKEQVRRTLAQENGCDYCRAKGKPDPLTFDERTALAVGFAEAFLKLRGHIPDALFDVLKKTFSKKEISELCAYICFMTASQYFGALIDLKQQIP